MQKYCENCGAKLNEGQNACTECGNLINKNVTKSDKKNFTGYYISTSIVMMFIALCMFIADADSDFSDVLTFTIPALFALGAAITCLSGRKHKAAVIVSGALYIAGALCNIIAIANISIFAILAAVFGGLNIYYGVKQK